MQPPSLSEFGALLVERRQTSIDLRRQKMVGPIEILDDIASLQKMRLGLNRVAALVIHGSQQVQRLGHAKAVGTRGRFRIARARSTKGPAARGSPPKPVACPSPAKVSASVAVSCFWSDSAFRYSFADPR